MLQPVNLQWDGEAVSETSFVLGAGERPSECDGRWQASLPSWNQNVRDRPSREYPAKSAHHASACRRGRPPRTTSNQQTPEHRCRASAVQPRSGCAHSAVATCVGTERTVTRRMQRSHRLRALKDKEKLLDSLVNLLQEAERSQRTVSRNRVQPGRHLPTPGDQPLDGRWLIAGVSGPRPTSHGGDPDDGLCLVLPSRSSSGELLERARARGCYWLQSRDDLPWLAIGVGPSWTLPASICDRP